MINVSLREHSFFQKILEVQSLRERQVRYVEYDGILIGQSVRDIRMERGMTIEQLCEKVDKSVSHIHQMELGSRKMSIDLLLSLVTVLDTDANKILGIIPKEDTDENGREKKEVSIDKELDNLSAPQRDYLKGIFLTMIRKMPEVS